MEDNPSIHVIPRAWMTLTVKLAAHGANLHSVNLFLHGCDLPCWIIKSFIKAVLPFKFVLFLCFLFVISGSLEQFSFPSNVFP